MPTGYTADVSDGKVTDLRTFAMMCARDFGALITMRDEPADAPIPDEFKPSDFYSKLADEARTKLAALEAMSPDEVQAAAKAHDAARLAEWETRRAKRAETRQRYLDMMAQAMAWKPPTSQHDGLRRFMIEQLKQSIDFDCNDKYDRKPEPITDADMWHAGEIARLTKEIRRCTESQEKENQRSAERTAWVRALRDSFKTEG